MFREINPKKQTSDRFTIDEMSESVGLKPFSAVVDEFWEYTNSTYVDALHYHLSQGASEE